MKLDRYVGLTSLYMAVMMSDKLDRYCQRRNCRQLKVGTFQRCTDDIDVSGVPPLGGVKQRWGGINKLFSS